MSEKPFSPEAVGISQSDWEQTPASVRQVVESIHDLRKEVEKLREQVQLNSENSSQPPSSDSPRHKKEKSRRLPSKKKRGGQSGHQGHSRKLAPPEEVNRFYIHKPEACRHCGHHLEGVDESPYRWQVTELPEIVPLITEHQVHKLTCPQCGKTTGGKLPTPVARSQFGERLTSLIGLLMGQYRLSKRQVQVLIQDAFGITLSVGSVVNRQREISASLTASMQEVCQEVQQAAHRYIDETSWRESRRRSYLWGVVSHRAILFHIEDSRGSGVARALLGNGTGTTSSDRFSAYQFLMGERHQTCWAHLLRHFKRLELRGGQSVAVGRQLVIYTEYLLHRWRQLRRGELNRDEFLKELPVHQQDIRRCLEQGTRIEHPKTAKFCQGVLKHFDMLWTFTRYEDVDPTNNAVERALRHGVIWRKTSYGTDSEPGSRFVERILSILATCRLQNRNLLEFLHETVSAYRYTQTAPVLLPP